MSKHTHGLTREQILGIAEKYGEFQFGDAQGDKRLAFAAEVIAERERVRDAAPAPHPDTADAERWRFTRDNRVQYFEPTKLWRMTDANGALICEGVADSYAAAIDAARAQAQGSKP